MQEVNCVLVGGTRKMIPPAVPALFRPWGQSAGLNQLARRHGYRRTAGVHSPADNADVDELAGAKAKLRRTQELVTESGVRSDVRRMWRLTDEEVLARQNAAEVGRRSRTA